MHFRWNGTLSIQSLTGLKSVASFECEPTGDITLTLIATSISNSHRILGTTDISLKELTDSHSKLFIENWFELKSDNSNLTPTYLRVAASSTVAEQAPFVVNMVKSDESLFNSFCGFFSFLCGKKRNANYWTRFLDGRGDVLASVQMRYRFKTVSHNPILFMLCACALLIGYHIAYFVYVIHGPHKIVK